MLFDLARCSVVLSEVHGLADLSSGLQSPIISPFAVLAMTHMGIGPSFAIVPGHYTMQVAD